MRDYDDFANCTGGGNIRRPFRAKTSAARPNYYDPLHVDDERRSWVHFLNLADKWTNNIKHSYELIHLGLFVDLCFV